MRSRAIKPGLQGIGESHAAAIYHTMAKRVRQKYGLALPFSLTEFRVFCLERMGGSWDLAVQCIYCTRWLNAQTFIIDHREPLRYGGSLGIDNLDLVCEECNAIKGSLSSLAFRKLLLLVVELHAQDANEIVGRMKDGSAYVGLRVRTRILAQKKRARTLTNSLSPRQIEC
jgi:hypothetical protein